MDVEQNEPRGRGRLAQFFGMSTPSHILLPSQPLPGLNEQLANLELLASELAKEGHDVAEASRILDAIRVKLQSTESPDDASSYNVILNEVRALLDSAPKSLRFSRSVWPYILMAYEFLMLGFWVWLLFNHRESYNLALSNSHWSFPFCIVVSAITGSIAASTFAVYGLYSHLIYRNVHPGYVAWYIARPIVGGVMGAFGGAIGSVFLGGMGASGDGAHAFTIAVSFLAGSNEKFAAQMIERVTSKVLGVNNTQKGAGAAQRATQ